MEELNKILKIAEKNPDNVVPDEENYDSDDDMYGETLEIGTYVDVL